MFTYTARRLVTLAVISAVIPGVARAGITTFTVDPAQSELTLSGFVDLSSFAAGLTATFEPQVASPNSLLTSLTGSIDADLAGGSIEFISASLDADVSGIYEPDSSAGDYGLTSTVPLNPPSVLAGQSIVGAVRNIVFSLSSGPLPIDSNDQFDLSNDTFADIIAGVVDTDVLGQVAVMGSRTNPIADINDMPGTLTTDGMTQSLEMPLTLVFDNSGLEPQPLFPMEVTFAGTIVATRTIPEPSALIFLGCGSLFALRRRRNRQGFATNAR